MKLLIDIPEHIYEHAKEMSEDSRDDYGWNWQCSECGFVTPPSAKEIFTFCPKCGCKMEVEE